MLVVGYHKPPSMSTRFSPGSRPPPSVLGLQLLISQRINHGNALAVVIQCPPHFLNIPVLFHQFHRVNLPKAVRGHILRQSERLSGPLDILPDRLSGVVLPGVTARKDSIFPAVLFQVTEQGFR